MRRLALRRIAASGVDVVLVLLAAAVLALVVGLPLLAPAPGLIRGNPLAENLVGAALLVVPVTVTAAVLAHRRGATPGRLLLGVRVRAADGGPLSLLLSLLRSTIRIALPWALGHTAVAALAGAAAPKGVPSLPLVLDLVAAHVLPLSALVLLVVTGRPLHDLAARARVARTPDPG